MSLPSYSVFSALFLTPGLLCAWLWTGRHEIAKAVRQVGRRKGFALGIVVAISAHRQAQAGATTVLEVFFFFRFCQFWLLLLAPLGGCDVQVAVRGDGENKIAVITAEHRGRCPGRACSTQRFCLNLCPFATVATRKLPTHNFTVLDICIWLHHPNISVVPVVRHVLFAPRPPTGVGHGGVGVVYPVSFGT